MATTSPRDESAAAGQAPKKHRNYWIWISVVLAVAAIGLLIWALQTRSDLNAANDANAAAKGVVNDLSTQLGTTSEDLANTQQQLDDAKQAEDQAQKEADAAKQAAEEADNATDKANAEADQAKAEADAVQSKASIAADCAKAYVSAFGALVGGEGDEASVRQQVEGITADCKAAFAGT
jgi:preprotein translocase subunit SecF